MSKILITVSFLLSALSLIGVIASFLYFNSLHKQYRVDLEQHVASEEQWKTEFTKWRDDISGYVSSLYERYPTNTNEQKNLPVGIGL
jgi:hypothetical protein